MLITCVSFAEGMNKHLKQNIPEDQQEQLDNYFRKELTKIYETKEESVLMKYEIRRNEYA